MLSMQKESFRYGKNTDYVLSGVDADFVPGKFYTVFGPSGSGKTTCLSLLGGLDTPTAGEVLLDGISLRQIGGEELRRKHVSYIFQNYMLFPYMSAVQNVVTAIEISGKGGREAKQEAEKVLLSLGIEEKDMYRKVRKLSGGQQQRVAIARSVATGSRYILADEPTGNLDKKNAQMIIDIFLRLVREQEKCLVVVTHSQQVRDASDIRYELTDGQLSLWGEAAEYAEF